VGIPEYLGTAIADRYVIDREIGRGGMATVYLARDLRHDRAVALKLLNPELGAVLGIDRFLAEIRVTANLQHPNLLPLFDSGEANGQPFYAMPYVEGETLRHRIDREKQLAVDEALRIASAVAGALEYAHAHGVIHRDLKPENILLQAGQPVVADFGIALAVSKAGGARITQTGLSLGTPQYMSPEQATGDRTLDQRSDIYSLGAVTYEMLTGEPPHIGNTMQAVIARVLTERPRPIRLARPAVPEHTAVAVEVALEKLPADRWASARDFADALQGRAVGSRSHPTATAIESTRVKPRRAIERVRDPIDAGALVLGIGAAAVAGWALTRPLEDARHVTIRLSIPAGQLPPASQIALSSDGRFIAYAIRDSLGRQALAVWDLSQATERIIPGTEGAGNPFFSPDGAWLGFAVLGGRGLKKVPVAGGPVSAIADASNMPLGSAWTPNDVVVASVRDTLMTVRSAGGSLTPVPSPKVSIAGERGRRTPRLLPDGETVLYQSWRGSFAESRIGVVSLETGETTIIEGVVGSPIGFVDGLLIYATSAAVVMAAPFDLRSYRITGPVIPIVEQVDVTASGMARAAVSRNGSLIYLTGSPTSQVVVADMQGDAQVLLAEPRAYANPRFSPDGKRIALSITTDARTDIWLYDLASATPTRLTSEGARNDRPEWTPDGKRVLFASTRTEPTALWWQNADLSGRAALVVRENVPVSAGNFTPDGSLVYWFGGSGNQPDIYYRRLTGDTARKIIAATSDAEIAPKVSRDGKWVAYTSNQDGDPQVYVQPFPPTGGRYRFSANGGIAPVWSPDGHHLFYVANGRLTTATIQRQPTFTVTSRAPMFQRPYLINVPPHANYDVSPDGKSFVLVRPIGEISRIIVVHDWKYELRERVGGSHPRGWSP
jgi:serine/threonine-protein kinase